MSEINSKAYKTVQSQDPIQYLTGNVRIEEIYALCALADVFVMTPIRDGMNTLPFEYVVCREVHSTLATVVLSEFAGCARSLGGAMLVNPWNTQQMAMAMLQALDMDSDIPDDVPGYIEQLVGISRYHDDDKQVYHCKLSLTVLPQTSLITNEPTNRRTNEPTNRRTNHQPPTTNHQPLTANRQLVPSMTCMTTA